MAGTAAAEPLNPVAGLAAVLWTLHYLHRAYVYPLRTRTSGKNMPLIIMLAAAGFNVINGWLIGGSLSLGVVQGGRAELVSPQTLAGSWSLR